MVLDTSAEVQKLKGVQDRNGDTIPPANADEQAKTNARLGNFGSGIDGSTTDDATGSTLPANSVPDGVEVVVQAQFGNAARMKVGLTTSPTVELKPGQSASFRVSDTSDIHIQANSSGDGVAFSAEVPA